jgi:hypothetical protein
MTALPYESCLQLVVIGILGVASRIVECNESTDFMEWVALISSENVDAVFGVFVFLFHVNIYCHLDSSKYSPEDFPVFPDWKCEVPLSSSSKCDGSAKRGILR